MAIKDLNEIYQDYKEGDKFRAFLYSPSDILIREVEMINPTLSLRKRGFHVLEFGLPAKIFNIGTLENEDNDLIDLTLDGYQIEVYVGNIPENQYDTYRFIIKGRPNSLNQEKPDFRYSALSSEYELQQIPIIDWPGIEVTAYKQITAAFASSNVGPTLTGKVYLTKEPKDGTVIVSRTNLTYGVEIPLIESNVVDENNVAENEYFLGEDINGTYIVSNVPQNTIMPIDDSGTTQANSPVDEYKYYIYYETEEEVAPAEIIEGTFEESPYYKKDGLRIDEVIQDLFININQEFLGWSADTTSFVYTTEVRSGLTFSNTNVYQMLESLSENYNVYIHYDTVNRVLTVMPNDFGSNNGLRFEYGKYLKGINQDYNIDNMINYVQGQDANSIGFADVSWTGDNYIENYDYYLDGAVWNGASLVGTSRWLSNELATELAKIKYYQEQFEDEVWGDGVFEGIANARQRLLELIVEKEFKLEEINAEILNYDGLIENYNSLTDTAEDQRTKLNLDRSARETSYWIPVDEGDNVVSTSIAGISITPSSINQNYADAASFVLTSIPFSTFRLNGTEYKESIGYASSIKLSFYNGGVLQKAISITQRELNKEINLGEEITADQLVLDFKIRTSAFSTGEPQIITSIDRIQSKVKSWNTFVERQQYLKDVAEINRNLVQLEISVLRDGPEEIDFNPAIEITDITGYGILQFERRLEYIRQFTSVNFSGLSASAQSELKKIRRGAIYQNNDIVDSATLFKAAKEHLEDNKYPAITISIDSVSLLQTYEAYEDWNKVQIGEKIDIYVPQLKINVEAEIQEIVMDFQNYSTSLVISTVQNYDKTFGKFFVDTYKLLNNKVSNVINPTEKPNQNAVETSKENSAIVEQLGGTTSVGYKADGENDDVNPDEIVVKEVYIDPALERLTTTPPYSGSYPIYGDNAPGVAKLSNGGLYIKDEGENLRLILNSRNGLVGINNNGISIHIDMEGNAYFAGKILAATDLTEIDSASYFPNFYSTITSYADSLAIDLQNQIDGTIDTWFYNGTPTLINEPAINWTTDELKDQHIGDIYYDNDTGYAYRFSFNSPNYEWVEISDSAVVEALTIASNAQSTADSKMSIFYLSINDSELTAFSPELGDLMVVSPNYTDTTYEKNNTYKWNGATWIKTQNLENKDTGSIGGWEINSENILSNNGKITIHSDSANAGIHPYISIGQSVQGFGNDGLFLGIDTDNIAKIFIGDALKSLSWDGTDLVVKGEIQSTSGKIGGWTIAENALSAGNIILDAALGSEKISIGTTVKINSDGSFTFGDTGSNYIDWDNTTLSIFGDIGGTINKITIGNPTQNNFGIEIGSTGIFAYDGTAEKSFEIDTAGTAFFRGNIEASGGKIGDLYIGSFSLISGLSISDITDLSTAEGIGFKSSRVYSGGDIIYTTFLRANQLLMEQDSIEEGTYGVNISASGVSVGRTGGGSRVDIDQWGLASTLDLDLRGDDIQLNAQDNIYLKSGLDGTGFAYVSSLEFNGGINYKIDNSADAAPSTKIIKTDITEVSEEKIIEFLEKIEIKEYKNLLTNKKQVSLIIEDEELKNNPFSDILFSRNHGFVSFRVLPDFLLPYENDPEVITKKGNYFLFNPKVYDKDSLLAIAIKSIKNIYNKYKDLNEEILLLKNKNNLLNEKVSQYEDRNIELSNKLKSIEDDIQRIYNRLGSGL